MAFGFVEVIEKQTFSVLILRVAHISCASLHQVSKCTKCNSSTHTDKELVIAKQTVVSNTIKVKI